jgi:hypothetical protein
LERLGEDIAQRVVASSVSSIETPHKAPYPLLAYLRAIGGGGTILGGAGMILTTFFWWAAVLFYIGLSISLGDVCLERQLGFLTKVIGAGAILVVVTAFSLGIVAFEAPLRVSSFWDNGNNFAGSDADGIKWTSDMSRLVVFVGNPTDRDYIDFDFSIFTSEGVAAFSQTSFVPCEHISEQQTSISGISRPYLK